MTEGFWKWFQRITAFLGLISFIKGWGIMNQIKELWDNLTPWQLLFFLSIGGLVFTFIRDYFKMNSFKKKKYETFHAWMKKKDASEGKDYQHMAETSLEERIVAMLEWWDERKKKLGA